MTRTCRDTKQIRTGRESGAEGLFGTAPGSTLQTDLQVSK